MSMRTVRSVLSRAGLCAALCVFGAAAPIAQGPGRGAPAAPKPDNPQSLAHIEAARKLTGDDAWLRAPYDFFCVTGKARPNDRNASVLEPVRLFDNLYALGNSEATVYAITTSQGIILIDSGYADQADTVIAAGLRKLGLDPANVKYILLGHGHGDHFGGAQYFQEHYGTKVGTTAADWDVIHPANPPANQAPASAPKRDLVLSEGQAVTLGDQSVSLVAIPGHTPGSLAFIFRVSDGGTTHTVGLFGGTILTVDRITTPGLQQYVQSIDHYLSVAKAMKVDVEVQNHPIFDNTPARLATLRARTGRDPHPFVMGTDRYVKFWSVVSECIQAEVARRGVQP
jgi:metallo-beta-lactamase class B